MKALTRIRVGFVKEALMAGFAVHEIILQLSAEFGVARRTMDFYLSMAYREIEKEEQEGKLMMQKVRSARINREGQELMAGENELDFYLTQIIRGERTEERVVYTRDGPDVVRVVPNTNAVLKAMQLLYVRINNYSLSAPVKQKKTSSRDIVRFFELLVARQANNKQLQASREQLKSLSRSHNGGTEEPVSENPVTDNP